MTKPLAWQAVGRNTTSVSVLSYFPSSRGHGALNLNTGTIHIDLSTCPGASTQLYHAIQIQTLTVVRVVHT